MTNDVDVETTPAPELPSYGQDQRAWALAQARRDGCGIVTVNFPAGPRSYPNSWVPAGQEFVQDV